MKRACMAVIVLLIVNARSSFLSAGDPPGIALERRVVEGRRKIQHGKLTLTALSANGISLKQAGQDVQTLRYAIEFDGEKIRVETGHNETIRISVPEWVIMSNRDGIYWHDRAIVNTALSNDIFDPRMLGIHIAPLQGMDNYSLDTFILFDQKDMTIKDELLNGIPVKHLSYHRVVPVEIDRWIAPEMGYAVLRSKAVNDPYLDTLETEYQEVEPGLWFPRKIHYTQYRSDRIINEDLITVESVDLSEPPASERFTLDSLKLPPGQKVDRNGESMLWDGNKLLTQRDAAQQEHSLPPPENGRKWLLLLNAGILALIALILVVSRRKKQVDCQ